MCIAYTCLQLLISSVQYHSINAVGAGVITDVDIPEPDYSDSDDDQLEDAVDEEIQTQLISAKKLINPCLESEEHRALRRELAFNQKLYV